MSSGIPQEVWNRWLQSDFDPLRQAVLVFGGSLKKEIALEYFNDVSLLYQEGEGTNTLKGVFYLTTKRLVFLPKNQIPHPSMVEATYNVLTGLSGVRSDLTITVTDTTGSVANFQFPTTKSLYQCFNLLRALAEASRKDENKFRKIIINLVKQTERDETPFSSIEVDLPECHQTLEVPEASSFDDHATPVPEDTKIDRMTTSLAPLKSFFDYCNHLNFDIHIKLRILFFMSLASFCMKFIPFLPLVCLLIAATITFNGWDYLLNGENNQEQKFASDNQGVIQIQNFFEDWFGWQNPKKSQRLLYTCVSIFISWVIMPRQLFVILCSVCYAVFIIVPVYNSNVLSKIVTGFWFCT